MSRGECAGARCDNCLFGRMKDIEVKGVTATVCECHVARPTRYGFPKVREDDFCACHVSAATLRRTFAGLAGNEV